MTGKEIMVRETEAYKNSRGQGHLSIAGKIEKTVPRIIPLPSEMQAWSKKLSEQLLHHVGGKHFSKQEKIQISNRRKC